MLILAGMAAAPAMGHADAVQHVPIPSAGLGTPPASLFGLWARGRRCGMPDRQLRITAHAIRFAGEKPLRYWYFPGEPEPDQGSVYVGTPGHPGLTYDTHLRILFDAPDSSDPDHVYFPCSGLNPGWPPRETGPARIQGR